MASLRGRQHLDRNRVGIRAARLGLARNRFWQRGSPKATKMHPRANCLQLLLRLLAAALLPHTGPARQVSVAAVAGQTGFAPACCDDVKKRAPTSLLPATPCQQWPALAVSMRAFFWKFQPIAASASFYRKHRPSNSGDAARDSVRTQRRNKEEWRPNSLLFRFSLARETRNTRFRGS